MSTPLDGIAGLEDFVADIEHWCDKPQAAPALKKWTEELAGDLGKGFLQSQSPLGQAWAPLKRPRPPGHNQGSRPLIDTGDLLQSVVSRAANNIDNVADDSVEYGTKDPKAIYHQEGTETIPARPFLDVSPAMADRAAELVADQAMAFIGTL